MNDKLHGKSFILNDGNEYIIQSLSIKALKQAQNESFEAYEKITNIYKELEKFKDFDDKKMEDPNYFKDFQNMMKLTQDAQELDFEINCNTVFKAFSRNYTHITKEDFLDIVTPSQLKELTAYVLGGEVSIKKN